MEKKIKGLEAKFITHLEKKDVGYDVHFVKEYTHYEDGTSTSRLKLIEDVKYPVYVTKDHYRKHVDKKETEALTKLKKVLVTNSTKANDIAKELNMPGYSKNSMRDVAGSSYLYGADIDSSSFLKQAYDSKYGISTPNKVCCLDIENDVFTNEITVSTIMTLEKMLTNINPDFIKGIDNVEAKLLKLYEELIPETYTDGEGKQQPTLKHTIKPNFRIANSELDLIENSFANVHTWSPDVLNSWSSYDMRHCADRLMYHNVHPKDVFSDPDIPKALRYYKFKEGQTMKVTESGRKVPRAFQDIWTTVVAPAKWYWIDSMVLYNYIRLAEAAVPTGYGLDSILNKELKLNKLKFDKVTSKKKDWHVEMSRDYPLEYIIYNIWDVMSMLQLEIKNNDSSLSLPMFSGYSPYEYFGSGPKKLVTDMYFNFLGTADRVIGTKPPVPNSDKILGLDDWIITLQNFKMHPDTGKKIVYNLASSLQTIYKTVGDLDISSSYPSITDAANVSKDTTRRELINIKGVDKAVFKKQNINTLYGPINSGQYCRVMFNRPDHMTIVDQVPAILKEIADEKLRKSIAVKEVKVEVTMEDLM